MPGSITSMQDYLDTNNADENNNSSSSNSGNRLKADNAGERVGPSDSTLLARSLAAKTKGMKGEDDDEPMTTAAIRELRKLQKERIYNRTLIRVKFPDRVCIQGYFHPRHSLLDVYQWVYTSLSMNDGSDPNEENMGENKREINGQKIIGGKKKKEFDFFQFYELYTSPPRCVLHPYLKDENTVKDDYDYDSFISASISTSSTPSSSSYFSTSSTSSFDGQSDVSKDRYMTLIKAHLVPASLIHLNWGINHAEYKDKNTQNNQNNYTNKTLFTSSSSSASAISSSDKNNENTHNEDTNNENTHDINEENDNNVNKNEKHENKTLGSYLSAQLLSRASEKNTTNISSTTNYPSSETLNPSLAAQSGNSNSNKMNSSDSLLASEGKGERKEPKDGNEKKSKWLKIGK